LVVDDQIIQTEVEKIGIRSIELTQNEFLLNGEKKYFRGTNRHQEYPYVGYAISKNANRRDAIKIKQAGFDFVRLSHYPQDISFLEACDELGLLVMNAIPGWQYYSDDPEFLKNSYQDIRDMVRRDRNHPSVVFWEVSLNESPMTDTYMVEANKILKEELPFEDTYSAGWIDHEAFDLYFDVNMCASA
jgi:beta-galactosidase